MEKTMKILVPGNAVKNIFTVIDGTATLVNIDCNACDCSACDPGTGGADCSACEPATGGADCSAFEPATGGADCSAFEPATSGVDFCGPVTLEMEKSMKILIPGYVVKNIFTVIDETATCVNIDCGDETLVFHFLFESFGNIIPLSAEITIAYKLGVGRIGAYCGVFCVDLPKGLHMKLKDMFELDYLTILVDDEGTVLFQIENQKEIISDQKETILKQCAYRPFKLRNYPVFTTQELNKFLAIVKMEPSALSQVLRYLCRTGYKRYAFIELSEGGVLKFFAGTTVEVCDITTNDQQAPPTSFIFMKAPASSFFQLYPSMFTDILPLSSSLAIGFVPGGGLVFEYEIPHEPLKSIKFVFSGDDDCSTCEPYVLFDGCKDEPKYFDDPYSFCGPATLDMEKTMIIFVPANVVKNIFMVIDGTATCVNIDFSNEEKLVFHFLFGNFGGSIPLSAEITIVYELGVAKIGGCGSGSSVFCVDLPKGLHKKLKDMFERDYLAILVDDEGTVLFQIENQTETILKQRGYQPFSIPVYPFFTTQETDKFLAIVKMEPSALSQVLQYLCLTGYKRYVFIKLSEGGVLQFSAGTTAKVCSITTNAQQAPQPSFVHMKAPTHSVFQLYPSMITDILPLSSSLAIGFVPWAGIVFEYEIPHEPLKSIKFVFSSDADCSACEPHILSKYGWEDQLPQQLESRILFDRCKNEPNYIDAGA